MEKVKFTVEIDKQEVETLIKDVFMNIDIMRSIGYWATIIDGDDRGMLVSESDEDYIRCGGVDMMKRVEFRITYDFAMRCVGALVQMTGANFDEHDAGTYDCAVQMAVFGEIKYG